jgi:hypothetical protein
LAGWPPHPLSRQPLLAAHSVVYLWWRWLSSIANYNEPYVCGLVCPCLFYLEANDYVDVELLATDEVVGL